jgi:predicted DsbA family dithiol-disulfide isomerase
MEIKVVIDTICPWCFLGKRRLETTLAREPHLNFKIIWHPHILNPEIPLNGVDVADYKNEQLGGIRKYEKLNSTINQMAKSHNIEFNFSKIKRIPNTIDAHRMIKLASRQNLDSEMLESIYQNYFFRGNDIGNKSILIDIGVELGFDSLKLEKYLYSNQDIKKILHENQRGFRSGIDRIPAFIFNQEFSISGIHDIKILKRMLKIAEENSNNLDNQREHNTNPFSNRNSNYYD